jgi:hypothetical protein
MALTPVLPAAGALVLILLAAEALAADPGALKCPGPERLGAEGLALKRLGGEAMAAEPVALKSSAAELRGADLPAAEPLAGPTPAEALAAAGTR